ncbi:MAG: reverse transcriptase domain-containing protein [Candidatus Omnitrophota bacterium]
MIDALKWYRLSVTFQAQKSSNQMKSHPVSVFQAIIKAVSSQTPAFSSLENKDMPIFHIRDKKHSYKMKPYDSLRVDFFFFKQNMDEIFRWRQHLLNYLSEPIYSETFTILTMGEIEERNFRSLTHDYGELSGEGECCLEFLMPLPFHPEKGKARVSISKKKFIALFEKRFSDCFGFPMTYESGADDFTILPYYWRYTEIKHASRSQRGVTQYINGTIGTLIIKGTWKNFIPFLLLGAELHTGSRLANSQGYYRILPGSVSYFSENFPDIGDMISITRDVIENYDHAAEWLSRNEAYPFDEKAFAEKLCEEITSETYLASPNTAFLIQRKNKKDRVVEQMNFRDLIVARYLVKIIYKVFDPIYEEESIGSRKGVSRDRAVEMVKRAVEEGYEYILESDIEDFFPSIDLNELSRLLDHYLPSGDGRVKRLLEALTRNGYQLNGRYVERQKGLALGNPLSSCLANLYLDSFDEYVKTLDVRLIRYEDQFIICYKRFEDIETISRAFHIEPEPNVFGPTFFQKGGNLLKKEKVCIEDIGVSVGLMGGLVTIQRGRNIESVIPLYRVGEIEIRGDSRVSAGLLRRCKEKEILLAIRLIGGYLISVFE